VIKREFKSSKRKENSYIQEKSIRLSADFSAETAGQKTVELYI